MLTGKQKRYLRAQANQIKALFQIGKQGVTENMVAQLTDLLDKRELIKVSILQNCPYDKKELAEDISEQTGAYIVQIIGNNIVLYKQSQDNPFFELP